MFVTPGSRATRMRITAGSGSTATGTATPGGTSFNLQYNSSGLMAGSSNANYDPTANVLVLGSSVSMLATNPTVFQIHGTNSSAASASVSRWSSDTAFPVFYLNKSRGASIGTQGISVLNDTTGRLVFQGSDGVSFQGSGAISSIIASTPTPGAGFVNGSLSFQVSNGGLFESVRFDNIANVTVGGGVAPTATFGNRARVASQMQGTGTYAFGNFISGNQATGGGFTSVKTRGAGSTAHTAVINDDTLFVLDAGGSDGIGYIPSSTIRMSVDGTVAANIVPGKVQFYTCSTSSGNPIERLRVSNNGQISNGAPITGQLFNGGVNGDFQIMDISGEAAVAVIRYSNGVTSGRLHFAKSRGATVGTNTIVQVGDELGEVSYEGANGATFSPAASIQGLVDTGTPSSTSMPGRVCIFTVPDGSLGLVERVRIDSAGRTLVNTTTDLLVDTAQSQFTVAADATSKWGQNFLSYGNVAGTTGQVFSKTRGTVSSSLVAVQSSDTIGGSYYYACTGGGGFQMVAQFNSHMDGINGVSAASAMYGRLEWHTVYNGAVAAERMRLDSTGNLWLIATRGPAVTPPNAKGNVNETVACYNHQVYGGL